MKVYLILFSLLLSNIVFAQSKLQIRFRTGLTTTFHSPGGNGYAYKTDPRSLTAIPLGGEFSIPLKNKKFAIQVGYTYLDTYMGIPYPNEKNVDPHNLAAPSSFGFWGVTAPSKSTIYFGIEKFIRRDYKNLSKNCFSVFGGLALNFTLDSYIWGKYSDQQKYMTKKGGVIEGYTADIVKPKFPIAPAVYGGIRYNIMNKKRREAFIFELSSSYGFTPFFNIMVDYTLDGNPKRDKLKELGFCAQSNFIIPLYTFRKKKK